MKRQDNENDKDMKITGANWRIMVDERTQMKFTNFFDKKWDGKWQVVEHQ